MWHCGSWVRLPMVELYCLWPSLWPVDICAKSRFWHSANSPELITLETTDWPSMPLVQLTLSYDLTQFEWLSNCTDPRKVHMEAWLCSCKYSLIPSPYFEGNQLLFADLPGHRALDTPLATVPTDILSILFHSDLVLRYNRPVARRGSLGSDEPPCEMCNSFSMYNYV